jgi:hypothetical protein
MKHICVIIALAGLFAGSSALAGARQHFMAGQDYYTQGRYDKAIEEFEEAYRLEPKPLLLYNIAMAQEKVGELVKAVDYLKRYLEATPDNEDRTTLLAKVANLETRIAKTGIKITASEAEATVYVDGKDIGKTPVAGVIPLSVGAHKIKVSKKGFEDFKMNVAVSSGQTTPIEATMEKGQVGPAPVIAEGDEEEGDDEEEEDGEGVEALDVVPWAVAGVGGVTAIVGWGVIGAMAKSKQPADPDADPAAQNDAHDMAFIADILGGVGAAIAVGGTIWGIMRLTKKDGGDEEPGVDDETDVDVEVSVLPIFGDTNGVAAVIRF